MHFLCSFLRLQTLHVADGEGAKARRKEAAKVAEEEEVAVKRHIPHRCFQSCNTFLFHHLLINVKL